MSLFTFFNRKGSAPAARERLQILLAHERVNIGGQSDLVTLLREEILAVVAKHVTIDPEKVTICHCTDCQKLTGTAFRVSVPAPRENIRLTGAEPALYIKTAENGRRRLQYFCGLCGSQLFTTGEGEDAKTWGIRWGGIDQREALVPRRQIWRRSAVSWIGQVDGLPARDKQ